MSDQVQPLFTTPAMTAVFSAPAHVQAMLDFEAALARAEAELEIIPQAAALEIAGKSRVELFDVAALYRETALAGTPAIPLVRMLTALVEGEAKRYVHWGATSQDAIDTALMLQSRAGLDLLLAGLLEIAESCAQLAEKHRATLMVGRTLLQQALPLTFGLKAARWLALVTRQVEFLREQQETALAVQLGGAAGTLASLGDKGPEVVERLAAKLKLAAPELPWHTERDRVGRLAGSLGVVAGAMAKIGTDLALLAQTEVGEAREGELPGKGGSSAMPQKRNPVDTMLALAAARLAVGAVPVILGAMGQEHERAVGGWQAEWTALPDLFRHTAGAVEGIRAATANLEIDADRMRANLDRTNGLVLSEALTMALAPKIGRAEAYKIVQAAVKQVTEQGKDLRQAVLENPQARQHLTEAEIDQALDPASYLGSANLFIDRALAGYRRLNPAPDR
ncbi:MAG: 3-carboxy-cis,cis-muconate cycloisomerase [Chloroflexi bacterium]|nr:3-carboxy-cis,cis-muconate cycloisomerase [Chloroflexota bacterium]OJV94188.1 MAG: 3-carboxy-cis,cis-muconate cycloisomerase [Chloroflexi bacterium 54-19]